jgi:hypothetical protein
LVCLEVDDHIVQRLAKVALLKGDPTDRPVCDSGRETLLKQGRQIGCSDPVLERETSTTGKLRRLGQTNPLHSERNSLGASKDTIFGVKSLFLIFVANIRELPTLFLISPAKICRLAIGTIRLLPLPAFPLRPHAPIVFFDALSQLCRQYSRVAVLSCLFLLTITVILLGDTPIAVVSAFATMRRGFRNSAGNFTRS